MKDLVACIISTAYLIKLYAFVGLNFNARDGKYAILSFLLSCQDSNPQSLYKCSRYTYVGARDLHFRSNIVRVIT
jgi:hypothetical protein